MEDFAEGEKAVGLIFDVSLRHAADGRRIIDVVKQQAHEIVMTYLENDLDSLYLFHPDLIDVLTQQGEQTAAIANYETDGWKFDLNFALVQSLYVLEGEDQNYRRYLFLITDRLCDLRPLESTIRINAQDHIDCQIVVVGVGSFYARGDLESLAAKGLIKHYHLTEPTELVASLFKEPDDSGQASCCSSVE